jgi:hypothetical protein
MDELMGTGKCGRLDDKVHRNVRAKQRDVVPEGSDEEIIALFELLPVPLMLPEPVRVRFSMSEARVYVTLASTVSVPSFAFSTITVPEF